MYTFKITYIFIIYNLNIFFPIFLFLYIVHYLICGFFLILVLYCIPTVLFLCMSVLSCMSALCQQKVVYIVEITRISAFHGYMTCPTFFFVEFLCLTTLPCHHYVSRRQDVCWILKNSSRFLQSSSFSEARRSLIGQLSGQVSQHLARCV